MIVTRNDYITGVFNGDTGVVIDDDGRLVVAMEGPGGHPQVRPVAARGCGDVVGDDHPQEPGLEFDHAIVSLPGATSPVLTNELLYTAVTRAREKVTVVADEDSIRAAVGRRIARGFGPGARLWP
ncbi:MAG: ATP-dependent RecD-like DNA helicase [Microthrixaceae bacterium]|nr:ATP-dependent RecD-like DNA helicase [Microthrixaceae bacterium]